MTRARSAFRSHSIKQFLAILTKSSLDPFRSYSKGFREKKIVDICKNVDLYKH